MADLSEMLKSAFATIDKIKEGTRQSLSKLEVALNNENGRNSQIDDGSMVEFRRDQVRTNNLMLEMQLAIVKCHETTLKQIIREISQLREASDTKESEHQDV